MKLFLLMTSMLLVFSCNLSAEIYKICDKSMSVEDCEIDQLSFEAIKELHNKLDDDKDGSLDPSETDDFARDELSYVDGFDRTSTFHDKDKHITVEELWLAWKNSPVYNWTLDDVADWMTNFVHLPQYVEVFMSNKVNGPTLPRLAVNNPAVFGNLKIKNAVHRHKISLKAIDVVLFGPPKVPHNYLKDIMLTGSIIIGALGCWFAYVQRLYSKIHLQKMNLHLSGLSKAETSLVELQKRLEVAENVKEKVSKEKELIEKKYEVEIQAAKKEASRLNNERSSSEDLKESLRLAEEELICLRSLLAEAEASLGESKAWQPSPDLLTLLHNTKEIEKAYWSQNKVEAEYQLKQAKELCDKIKRKQGSLLGPLFLDNSGKMEDVERKINMAVDSLKQVNSDFQDLQSRWNRIEQLLGCPLNSSFSDILRTKLSSDRSSSNSLFHSSQAGESRRSGHFANADEDSDSETDCSPFSHDKLNLKNKAQLTKPEAKFRKAFSVVKAAGEFSKKTSENAHLNSMPTNSLNSSTGNFRDLHPRFFALENCESSKSKLNGSFSSLNN